MPIRHEEEERKLMGKQMPKWYDEEIKKGKYTWDEILELVSRGKQAIVDRNLGTRTDLTELYLEATNEVAELATNEDLIHLIISAANFCHFKKTKLND
jgi:hypothetical protein